MIRFFVLFLVLLVVLFGLELTHPVQATVVLSWTALVAQISAALIGLVDASVISYGKVLQHAGTGIGVSIEAGCNGIEACIILIAGMLAYPASWKLRTIGIVAGVVAVQAVNVLRVITLFYLAAWNHWMFEFSHLYLWQVLIMLDVVIVWLVWIRVVAREVARDEAYA